MSDPKQAREAYWKKNRRLIALLLAIWAPVSYGFAILTYGWHRGAALRHEVVPGNSLPQRPRTASAG